MATTTNPMNGPPLTVTPCDSRCPASSLVMVSRQTTPPGWTDMGRTDDGTPIYRAPTGTPVAPPAYLYLTFCGHHYHEQAIMLAAHGWRVVADMRTWKADES